MRFDIIWNGDVDGNSSKLSLRCADEARQAVLSHFRAPSEYTVVFTANASAALKIVGEAYPFTGGSSLVIGADSHNSVRALTSICHSTLSNSPLTGAWHT